MHYGIRHRPAAVDGYEENVNQIQENENENVSELEIPKNKSRVSYKSSDNSHRDHF